MTRYLVGLVCVCALGVLPLVGCGEGGGEGGTGGTAGTGGTGGTGGSGGMGGAPECQGPEDCNDAQECTADACSAGICSHMPAEDGSLCVINSPTAYVGFCAQGICRESCEGLEDGTVCTDYDAGLYGFCFGELCRKPECAEDTDCGVYNDCTKACLAPGLCVDPVDRPDGTRCAGGTCQSGACALQGTVLPCTEQGIRNAIAAGGGPYTFDCDGPTAIVIEAEIVIDNDVILDGQGNLIVSGGTSTYVRDHRVFYVPKGTSVELQGLTVTKGGDRGIDNQGMLTLINATVSGNGIFGVENRGELTLIDSTVSGNQIGLGNVGGTLTVTDSIVSGNISDVGDGAGIFSRGVLGAGATVTLTNTTVSGNHGNIGGGIYNYEGTMTIVSSTVDSNTANSEGGCGGIVNGGRLTLINSTVSGNISDASVGGICSGGVLTLIGSTVSGNIAARDGGGISNSGTLTLTNSTVSDNTATNGGGIVNGGRLTLINSTISGNISDNGSGITALPRTTLTLTSTLLDNDCAIDLEASVISGGHNIESPGDTCGFDQPTDQVNVTAEQLKLGPLADNGGPTMTHALGAGSVAIDAIPEAMCEVDTDQRGVTRPQNDSCDVGAFELEVAP